MIWLQSASLHGILVLSACFVFIGKVHYVFNKLIWFSCLHCWHLFSINFYQIGLVGLFLAWFQFGVIKKQNICRSKSDSFLAFFFLNINNRFNCCSMSKRSITYSRWNSTRTWRTDLSCIDLFMYYFLFSRLFLFFWFLATMVWFVTAVDSPTEPQLAPTNTTTENSSMTTIMFFEHWNGQLISSY